MSIGVDRFFYRLYKRFESSFVRRLNCLFKFENALWVASLRSDTKSRNKVKVCDSIDQKRVLWNFHFPMK